MESLLSLSHKADEDQLTKTMKKTNTETKEALAKSTRHATQTIMYRVLGS